MKTNDKYSISPNNLRSLRHQFNLRQTDMADIMGFEVIDRICHWERGRAVPGLINAIRLCVLYNTDLSNLYPELYKQVEGEIHASKNSNYLKNIQDM